MASKKLVSALPPLTPHAIIDTNTGEVLSRELHDEVLTKLISFVQEQASAYYAENKNRIESDIGDSGRIASPAEWARQKGYSLDKTLIPSEVRVKSRVERLFRHKLVSEVAAFVRNPNPRKQAPQISPTINLGAVDKKMASMSVDGNILSLLFKPWDRELLLEFKLPDYLSVRNIKKWSLPAIERTSKGIWYRFSIIENPQTREASSNAAGVDLGRREPFVMAIVNSRGGRIAHYSSSPRLRELNSRRERLIVEKRHTVKRAKHYEDLGVDASVLFLEARRVSRKASVLSDEIARQVGASIAKKLEAHELNTLAVEDLRWAHGSKYGSRWAHSKTQSAIEHATARIGVHTKKVNPKNTSQECHACGARVTHNSATRTVRCINCQNKYDRDFNAAMNIAHKLLRYPAQQRRNGNNCSSFKEQVIEQVAHGSKSKKPITILVT